MLKDALTAKSRWALPLGLGTLWFLFLLALALWSVRSERAHVASMAEREAKAFFQQVVVTRAWNVAHGGVYVLATDDNQPNPYLPADERTMETADGLILTKINPAYMTRQISTIARDDHDVQFHITSLDPIRPGNKADEWEQGALRDFEDGAVDKFELTTLGEQPFYRYMAPLKAEARCMRCHGPYGHSDKTILGGISVSFAAQPLIQARKSSVAQTHIAFTMIFVVGFFGICGSTYQIQRKREEAERANRTKSLFLANMSHDMRTPLNGIMGMTELMQRKGLRKDQTRYADMVRHSAWSLMEIITDITDYSRLESGRLELSETTFDVRTLLDDALGIFRFETANKGLTLTGSVDDSVPPLLVGDAFRLKQVITNLVGNAVKFTRRGRVAVRVRAEAMDDRPDGVRLRVEVEDTGIGIPEAEQNRIFESFRQVDDSYAKTHEGTGLGLAICRQLVTMMGGRIAVSSKEGVGSIFSFDAILAAPDETEAEAEAAVQTPTPAPTVSPKRTLVVEDNPLNQTFAREILEDAGHSVTLAGNGREALEALQRNAFDIVFMDVQMPEMDGLEAVRRIRSGEAGEPARTVRIVAATAFAVPGDRDKCLEAGMDGYVVKPLRSEDLLAALADEQSVGSAEESDMKDATDPQDVIDMEDALARLGGKRELFDRLAATFIDDARSKLAALNQSVADGDMVEVLRLAHGLKNSAGMIAAAEMAEAARDLETAVREERLTEVPELHDRVNARAVQATAAVERILEA